MKVIVLGASGFIGFPAAQALVRAGHVVYGVTRSVSKAKQLATEESLWADICMQASTSSC